MDKKVVFLVNKTWSNTKWKKKWGDSKVLAAEEQKGHHKRSKTRGISDKYQQNDVGKFKKYTYNNLYEDLLRK